MPSSPLSLELAWLLESIGFVWAEWDKCLCSWVGMPNLNQFQKKKLRVPICLYLSRTD